MAAAGLPVGPGVVVQGDFLEPRGYAAARELLALPDRPPRSSRPATRPRSASCARRGMPAWRCPRDLSVVGFDDIPEASFVTPALTTVRQPLREMGRAAVRRLMSMLDDPQQPPTRLVLETELVVRESTAPPP